MRNNLSVAPAEALVSAPSIPEHQPPRSDARERKSASDTQAQALVQAFRMLGYRSARLDPLSLNESTTIPSSNPATMGLTSTIQMWPMRPTLSACPLRSRIYCVGSGPYIAGQLDWIARIFAMPFTAGGCGSGWKAESTQSFRLPRID